MKKLVLLITLFCLYGCAGTHIITNMGGMVGDSFQKSAASGLIKAPEAIAAWGYIKGQIEGVLANSYEIEMTPTLEYIIGELDTLYEKDVLSDTDSGKIMGLYCRLEVEVLKIEWDKYGVSIMGLITKYIEG